MAASRGVTEEGQPFEPDPGEGAERLPDGGGRFRRGFGGVPGPFGGVDQHREVESALAGEVGVDRPPGQLGPLGDPVDLGLDVAELGELLPGRDQHRRTGPLLLLCAGQSRHRVPSRLLACHDTSGIQMMQTSGWCEHWSWSWMTTGSRSTD